MKILLIEDDLAIGRALLAVFQDEGHSCVWLRMTAGAQERVQDEDFDAVILDLSLPDGDGMLLLKAMRGGGATLPVLIITARDSLQDRLNGFNTGADDYMIKPFDIAELLVRLRAIVRRSSGTMDAADHVWSAGPITVDAARMQVTRAGAPVTLSKTEFALLLALIKQPDRVLTRAELERRALPQSDRQTLDVHIFNLRKKIGETCIRTVRGVGYTVQV